MTTPHKWCLLSKHRVYSTPTLSRPLNKGRGRAASVVLTYEHMDYTMRCSLFPV